MKKQNHPLFSVIIPTFNSGCFIVETIASVQNQTISDFELIICDDCSTDNTVEIIERIAQNDKRIKLLKMNAPSGGPVSPTNTALNEAVGIYVAFLDHDDLWKNDKLEKIRDIFLGDPKIDFVLSNVVIRSELTGQSETTAAILQDGNISIENILSGAYFNTFSALVIKKTSLDFAGQLDSNLLVFADFEIITRMVQLGYTYHFEVSALTIYRVHTNNTSALLKSAKRRIADLCHITNIHNSVYKTHPKSLSVIYNAIGTLSLIYGNKRAAIRYLLLSISHNPFDIMGYGRLLSALFGKSFYRRASLLTKYSRGIGRNIKQTP